MIQTQEQVDALMRNPALWHPGRDEGVHDGLMEAWLLAVMAHPMPQQMLASTMEKLISHLSDGARRVALVERGARHLDDPVFPPASEGGA